MLLLLLLLEHGGRVSASAMLREEVLMGPMVTLDNRIVLRIVDRDALSHGSGLLLSRWRRCHAPTPRI